MLVRDAARLLRRRLARPGLLPRQADAQLRATRLEYPPQLEAEGALELAAEQRGEGLGEVRVLQRYTDTAAIGVHEDEGAVLVDLHLALELLRRVATAVRELLVRVRV